MRHLVVITAVACLTMPTAAGASSTVAFTDRYLFNGEEFPSEYDPSFVAVVGDEGASAVTAEVSGDSVTVTDTSGIASGKGCTQLTPTSASCPRPDTGNMSLGAGDDRADLPLGVFGAETEIKGGPGADVLNGPEGLDGEGGADVLTVLAHETVEPELGPELSGGDGDDQLNGSRLDETLHGGRGSDTLRAGGGDDVLDGDNTPAGAAVDEDILDGGEGRDVLEWDERNGGVVVDLRAGKGSGAAGEGDTLTGFEMVETGSGNDKLIGSSADETFAPSDGKDVVRAGAGDDVVEGGEIGLERRRSDTYYLGRGNDWISYSGTGATGLDGPIRVNLSDPGPDGPPGALDRVRGAENVRGSVHRDELTGDGGANILVGDGRGDMLDGRKGRDTLSSGSGGDTVRARDGAADEVDCGSGKSDTVRADSADDVKRCEKRG
jgi:Ca2+-binding RTX toxin-like protein